MDAETLVQHARRIIKSCQSGSVQGSISEATELFRVYAGEKSAFYVHLTQINRGAPDENLQPYIIDQLEAFIRYVEDGLLGGISLKREAQIDVVSDFLEQASTLLDSEDVHPAGPTVIIGAALEEFLRNWVEEAQLDLQGAKPSIDAYAKVLRKADLITKQDIKDITAWAGLRNHTAHGQWDDVNDKNQVSLMHEGVNLFMRKYAQRAS